MWVKITVDVVDYDLVIVAWNIGHDKVLFKSSWQHAVELAVNMLAKDTDTTRCTAEELRTNSVELLESSYNLNVAWLMLRLHGAFNVLVDLSELLYHGYRGCGVCCTVLLYHIFRCHKREGIINTHIHVAHIYSVL